MACEVGRSGDPCGVPPSGSASSATACGACCSLREVDVADIDFYELAQRQFLHQVDARLKTSGEGDKVWRRLRAENRIIGATIVALEPLGEGPAIEYVLPRSDGQSGDWPQIVWLVRATDVAHSPLFLQLIDQLREGGRLRRLASRPGNAESQPVDRVLERWRLLESWRGSLIEGCLREDYGLPPHKRKAALEVLSALACIALPVRS